MRFHSGLKWHCMSIAALTLLSACGGGDGSQSAASRAGAASTVSPGETALVVPSTAVAVAPGVDKTLSPVEMPDTVIPVSYKLWFRPNPELNAFDGRADVEIKVVKPVTFRGARPRRACSGWI